MRTDARVIRRAARTLAQADMADITVTDSGKDDDGSWWLLVRDEGWADGRELAAYYRITLTIEEDE